MVFLTVLAGHVEPPAVDGDADLGHCRPSSLRSGVLFQDAADGVDRRSEPIGDVAIGRFQTTPAGSGVIELVSQPGAIVTERFDLLHQRLLVPISVAPPLASGVQGIKRNGEPPPGDLNQVRNPFRSFAAPLRPQSRLVAGENWSDGNHLQKELYVAWSKSVNA